MNNDELKRRLDGLQQHINPAAPKSQPPQNKLPARYHRLAKAVGGQAVEQPNGAVCVKTTLIHWTDSYGNCRLGDWRKSDHLPVAAFTTHESDERIDVSRMLFFDTETTGLGGAGTVAFLIGCGSVTTNGFEVRQYLLPDYSDEAAQLEMVFQEFSDRPLLVSFNGVAFDAPVLRDRMIVNRVARSLPDERHLDLLHPARRLFRRRLKDCRLINLEEQLFGFVRDGDIPGYLVPSVYFDWLGEERLDDMPSVLRHNCWDIVSMFLLAQHLAQIHDSEGKVLTKAEDALSLSRLYQRRRRNDQALRSLEHADALGDVDPSPEIRLSRALALKRVGRWEEAAGIWHELADGAGLSGPEACVELAKYFEHKERDFSSALQFTKKAARIAPSPDLEHRAARLKRRLSRR